MTTEEIQSFNEQSDRIRKELFQRTKMANEAGRDCDHLVEIMNIMEYARRVFNNFAATGKVEIPD